MNDEQMIRFFTKIDEIWAFVNRTATQVAVDSERLDKHILDHDKIVLTTRSVTTIALIVGAIGGAIGIVVTVFRLLRP